VGNGKEGLHHLSVVPRRVRIAQTVPGDRLAVHDEPTVFVVLDRVEAERSGNRARAQTCCSPVYLR
jgi:hypothetical protein